MSLVADTLPQRRTAPDSATGSFDRHRGARLSRPGSVAAIDVTASLDAGCAPTALLRVVDDLGRYPDWLDLVARAQPAEEHAGDGGNPAWLVDLRARLGPLARSKRLRMVRTRADADGVTFERAEHDGRDHSPWVLRADVTAQGEGSVLTMHLHYGGSLFGPVLARVLEDEIKRSRPRLRALVES